MAGFTEREKKVIQAVHSKLGEVAEFKRDSKYIEERIESHYKEIVDSATDCNISRTVENVLDLAGFMATLLNRAENIRGKEKAATARELIYTLIEERLPEILVSQCGCRES